jgi:hypothetical protein
MVAFSLRGHFRLRNPFATLMAHCRERTRLNAGRHTHGPATISGARMSRHSPPEKRSTETTNLTPLKFSAGQLILAFVVAGVSDVIGALASLAPPIVWVIDVVTAALLFVVLGWQWLLLPGLVLEAIPGVEVLPFWLLVVGGIAIFGTPRPKMGER